MTDARTLVQWIAVNIARHPEEMAPVLHVLYQRLRNTRYDLRGDAEAYRKLELAIKTALEEGGGLELRATQQDFTLSESIRPQMMVPVPSPGGVPSAECLDRHLPPEPTIDDFMRAIRECSR